jgi:hypothetical protein
MLFTEGDRLSIGPRASTSRKEYERFFTQARDGDVAPGRQPMICRNDRDERFGKERRNMKALLRAAISQYADVPFPISDRFDYGRGVSFVKMKLNPGVFAAIFTERSRERGEHRGSNETDAKKPGFSPTETAGFFEIFPDIAQCATGALQKYFSRAGESDRTGSAGKERAPDNLFELTDLLGKGRLSEMEAFRGAAKMEFLGDRREITKMAKLNLSTHIFYILIAMNQILDILVAGR